MLTEYEIDILGISETWLKPNFQICVPPNYSILRNDRLLHAGGVAFLYKNNLKVRTIDIDASSWKLPTSIELLCCTFQLDYNKSFVVAVLYRTQHEENDLKNLDSLFAFLITLNKNFYLIGDLNFNLLCKPENVRLFSLCCRLKNIMHNYSLVQCVAEPTRLDSLLDLVITNDSKHESFNLNVRDNFVSDHRITVFYLSHSTKKGKYKLITYRDFRSIDMLQLNDMVNMTVFFDYDMDNINTCFEQLLQNIRRIFDFLAPVKTIKVKETQYHIPISDRCKRLMRDAEWHYKRGKSTGFQFHFDLHKSIKNEIKACTAKDSKIHFSECIKKRGVWDTMSSVFNLNFKKNGSCDYDKLCPENLNIFYANIPFPDNIKPYNTLLSDSCSDLSETSLFYPTTFHEIDLLSAWKSIKKKQSNAIDMTLTSKRMVNILMSFPNFKHSLLHFCNLSFFKGEIPDILKITRIVPIPKCKDSSEFKHFRPISISPFFMTLLERLYFKKLNVYVNDRNFLSPCQFGCRKGYSTEHAMIALTDNVKKSLDSNKVCAIVSIDLRNAFPSVHREKLLDKVKNKYGISDLWLRNYLSNRKHYVDILGQFSKTTDSLIGLPQGSVLGPSLFTYYINDLPEVTTNAFIQIFVDDTNLLFFGSPNNLDLLHDEINADMVKVNDWINDNALAVNSDKTKLMLIGTKSRVKSLSDFSFIFNSIVIQNSNELKCLGLTIDNTLSWEAHINNIARACHYRISSLFKIRDFIPDEYRKLLASTLVLPLMNYMSCLWCSAKDKYINVFEKVLRSLARFVSGRRKYDSVSHVITLEYEWLFPKELGEYKILCVFYSLTQIYLIDFFKNYFVQNNSTHKYETSSAANYHFNYLPRQAIGYTCFHYSSIRLWNSLPKLIKESVSLAVFKRELKKYLLSKQT